MENSKSAVAAANKAVFTTDKDLKEVNVDKRAIKGKFYKRCDLHENAKVLFVKMKEEIAQCSSAIKSHHILFTVVVI